MKLYYETSRDFLSKAFFKANNLKVTQLTYSRQQNPIVFYIDPD